jgi:hypothetical protein
MRAADGVIFSGATPCRKLTLSIVPNNHAEAPLASAQLLCRLLSTRYC